ncbi:hypothetical protein AB205_0115540 [Aquarana catesbeiana]|uniref:Uncharacterized protein n=1 Tax=Aquarana catesbeiana TaxID=8400 RepID=A0A2G9QBM5_AQUCT|nr:hypothetical protein AB205_0115540 [Aquarana catesbeiana]
MSPLLRSRIMRILTFLHLPAEDKGKHLLPAGRKAAGQQNRLKTKTRPINYYT